MRVLVTGSSGCLAAALLPVLCEDAGIERVEGIDLLPPRFAHPRFRARVADIADAAARDLLRGQDAVVHLAGIVLRGRRPARAVRAVNVDAAATWVEAAAQAGVRRQVLLSSAAVYGSGADLDEDAPLAPLAGFLYGSCKAELERRVAERVPECLRLRPHAVLGRHAQPLLRRLLRTPVYPRLAPPEPRLQCVHEDDVAEAIRLGLHDGRGGALNIAAPQTFSYGDMIRGLHPRAIGVPPALARAAMRAAWQVSGFGGEPGWTRGLSLPLTLDCRRAEDRLGWRPRHTAAQAISEAAGADRGRRTA